MKAPVLALALAAAACGAAPAHPVGPPPADPLTEVDHQELHQRGRAFARAGDFVRAEQYLHAALIKGGPEAVLVPEIVKVCVAASRVRAALAYARPFLDSHPEDAGMHFVVAHLYITIGELEEARAELERVWELSPELSEARFSLGVLAAEAGQTRHARRHLEAYLDAEPDGRRAGKARALLAELPRSVRRKRGRR